MDLVVPDHLAYCFASGRPVFLDTNRRRYFTIPDALGVAFGAVLEGGRAAGRAADVEALIRRQVLLPGAGAQPRRVATQARRENETTDEGSFRLSDAVSVGAEIWGVRRWLGREPFPKTLDRLRADRARPVRLAADQICTLSRRFLRHRAIVPETSVCLLDSIALRRFLAKRGGQADLVFGVIASPFAAHCWLQLDDQVLNDRLERITTFTPILVV